MRFLFFTVTAVVAVGGLLAAACGDSPASVRQAPDGDASFKRDGGIVEPPEAGGPTDAGGGPPAPSCASYCDLVMATCKDENVQYGSRAECLAVCALLPLGKGADKDESTVGCRELYAGGPAKTDSVTYCNAAGPFGGNLCGDRCNAFCQLTVAACAPDAGKSSPYKSFADCQTACAQLVYSEDGGEGPDGPTQGDTLNCRLYYLRGAVSDPSACVNIGADSGACR